MVSKRTATMTWLHNGNYGTMLQAWALQQCIKVLGYENIIIDYKPGRIMKTINLFTSGNRLSLFVDKFNAWKNKKKARTLKSDVEESSRSETTTKDELIEQFIRENLVTTKPYGFPFSLRKLRGLYDVYICGSDQIWNPTLLNPPYMFSYLGNRDKRIAYAPSFGVEKVEPKKVNKVRALLKDFYHISVREQQGIGVLQQLGLDYKNVPVVLDPTLLLSKSQWMDFSEEISEQPYVLCYFLAENEIYWKTAKKIAEEYNLKIIIIPEMGDSLKQPFDKRTAVGPKEWVSYVRNADFVLTDSFHCVLFSMMFHKDFFAWKRYFDTDKGSQNSRIINILNKVNLESRLLNRNDELPSKIESICTYNDVDIKIENERTKSIKYIIEAIEN